MATDDELALVRAAQKALQEFNSCVAALSRLGIGVEVAQLSGRRPPHFSAEFSRTERFGS